MIVSAAEDMLTRARDGRPPGPSDGDLNAVKALFTEDRGEVRLGARHALMLDRLRELKKRIAHYSKLAESIETQVRWALGEHGTGLLPDGRRVKLVASGSGRRLAVS